MYRRPLTCLPVCLAALGIVSPSAAIGAQPAGPVSLTVSPAQATLTPGATVTGVLVIGNTSQHVERLTIQAIPSATSVHVRISKRVVSVPCRSSAAITFHATRQSEGTGESVLVSFVATGTSARPFGRTVVVGTLSVSADPSPRRVDATIASNIGSINHNQPGQGELVVTNLRDRPLLVRGIDVFAPLNVDITVRCPNIDQGDVTVHSGTSKVIYSCVRSPIDADAEAIIPLTLRPGGLVTPGGRTLLVRVVESSRGGTRQSAVALLHFKVDVFAASGLLKYIGVPVFLLLPGFVVLVLSWLAISQLTPWRHAATTGSLENLPSRAAVGAILTLGLSLAMARAYPWLTENIYPTARRDYLTVYGFDDFYFVFVYSLAAVVVVWMCAWGLYFVAHRYWVFEVGDDPPALLRKIRWHALFGGRTLFPFGQNAKGAGGLVIAGHGAKVLLSPAIAVSNAGASAGEIEACAAANHGWKLFRAVQQAKAAGANVGFHHPTGTVAHPLLADGADVTQGQDRAIVLITPEP